MIRLVGCWEEPGEGSGQTCHYHVRSRWHLPSSGAVRSHRTGHRSSQVSSRDSGSCSDPRHRPTAGSAQIRQVPAVSGRYPEGTRLASASADGTVRLWDPTTGTQLATLTGHNGEVFAVAWSPDGTRLAAATGKGTIWVFDCDHSHLTYLQVEARTCLHWTDAGIAIGGPHGVGVLDLTHT
jgi:WD40 repeat protein